MKKTLPVFKPEIEEACFWDKVDTTEYLEEFEPVECEVVPELEEEILQKRELK